MNRYYFGDCEQIYKRGKEIMILMDIKADNLYAFKNFHMNMSYPKRIVDSSVPEEFLAERTNFRYKKVNIIMGGNATGKTSLGKLLMRFANYFNDGSYTRFIEIIDDRKQAAALVIDFVGRDNCLYRFNLRINPLSGNQEEYAESDVTIKIFKVPVNKRDNYEICAKKIDEMDCREVCYEELDTRGWFFSYPQDAWRNKKYRSIEEDENYLYILEQILKTLDPAIEKVVKVKEIENTYAIKLYHQSVIIKDGRITNSEVLSSGTKAGLDISYIIASLICDKYDLFFCDELFSYVNSDVEKACLSIIIDRLTCGKQLFFTTHNTEILDMQLPKHAYTFLKKDMEDSETPIKCVNAAEYLKRNTDSVRSAVENDIFCVAPELHRLFEIAELQI